MLRAGAEVQPHEAGSLPAVIQPSTEGDPSSLEEHVGWIVAEVQGPAVQPGKVRGLWRIPIDLGNFGGQKITENLAVPGQLITHGVQPSVARSESGFGGDDAEQPHAIGQRWHAPYCIPSSIAMTSGTSVI